MSMGGVQQNALPLDAAVIIEALDEAIVSVHNVPHLLQQVLDLVLQFLGAPAGAIYWLQRRTQRLIQQAVSAPGNAAPETLGPQEVLLAGDEVVAQVARSKQPWSGDGHDPEAPETGLGSALAVPFLSDDGQALAGVLYVTSPEPQAFTSQHLAALQILNRRIGRAHQRVHLDAVIRALKQKMAEASYGPSLADMTEALADLLYVPAASVWLVEPATSDLVLQHFVVHSDSSGLTPPSRLPRQSCLGQAMDTRQLVSLSPLSPDLSGLGQESSMIQQWGETLVIPLWASITASATWSQ